jgi:hypothetical protein
MKKSPDLQKLERILRSSKLSAVGFMGEDARSLTEIIDADSAELARLSYTTARLAEKMQQITKPSATGHKLTILTGQRLPKPKDASPVPGRTCFIAQSESLFLAIPKPALKSSGPTSTFI